VAQRRAPWRENIEAAVGAVVLAVLFKYFLLEFYRIPSGSMQPTLYGSGAPLELYDRVVADKLAYRLREPERFEVVIFRYPLDRSKNFVKRLVGLPGEELKLENGDLWVRQDESAPWSIPRRPAGVMEGQWRRLACDREGPRWAAEGLRGGAPPDWQIAGDALRARGAGAVRYVGHGGGPIRDLYVDGYPAAVAQRLPVPPRSGANAVGDLRLELTVAALPGCEGVTVEIEEGGLLHRFLLPGPAAGADARPRLESVPRPGRRAGGEPRSVAAGAPWRLPAGEAVELRAQNLDDRLTLAVDGETVLELDVEPIAWQESGVRVELEGQGADLSGLALARDVYYTLGTHSGPWRIPAGQYFMLGDNTQDSSDSRDWSRVGLSWSADDRGTRAASGNARPERMDGPVLGDTNPVRVRSGSSSGLTFLRDEWGEAHVFQSASELGAPLLEPAPFVPRELITGRALASLWPISPGLGVWRPKWIR
jgi:signal peptidase I